MTHTRVYVSDDRYAPIPSVHAEFVDYLDAIGDTSKLGKAWLYIKANKPESSRYYGWRTRVIVHALLDGDLPLGRPYLSRITVTTARVWLKKGRWSAEAKAHLTMVMDLLGPDAELPDPAADAEAEANTEAAESTNTAGVYVYTLPHYLRHYTDGDRTLLKVGHSGNAAVRRFHSQTNTTSLPEEPILLRIYPSADSAAAEAQFHELLTTAGHYRHNGRGGGAGREWFTTNTDYLDSVAKALRLDVVVVNDD